jgi:hypothetical protein
LVRRHRALCGLQHRLLCDWRRANEEWCGVFWHERSMRAGTDRKQQTKLAADGAADELDSVVHANAHSKADARRRFQTQRQIVSERCKIAAKPLALREARAAQPVVSRLPRTVESHESSQVPSGLLSRHFAL